MNPTTNPVSKKQQHQNHIQKKISDAGHFGRNTCGFAIFYKRCSQGRINERGLYSANIWGFIINKINLRRRAKINKGYRVCRNKFNIIGVKKIIRKIKLIRITDFMFKGRVERLNNTNIRRKSFLLGKSRLDLVTTEPTSKIRSDCIKDSRKTHPNEGDHLR